MSDWLLPEGVGPEDFLWRKKEELPGGGITPKIPDHAFDALNYTMAHREQRRRACPDVIHHFDTQPPPAMFQPFFQTILADFRAWRNRR